MGPLVKKHLGTIYWHLMLPLINLEPQMPEVGSLKPVSWGVGGEHQMEEKS